MSRSLPITKLLGIDAVTRLLALGWLSFTTWRMHPLSPTMPAAILRRNQLEKPL